MLAFAVAFTAPIEDENVTIMGDMIFLGDPRKVSRNANMNARKWDKGVIPYTFDAASGFSQAQKDIVINSMRKIEQQTNKCLSFTERTSEEHYVEFKDTPTGCNSYVGKINVAAQRISLEKPGCVYQEVVIHEILHAAGFEHEQCRYDRDQYIKVVYNNIVSGLAFAFDKLPATVANLFDIPYDYYSIMHYRWDAFSSNGRATIMALDPTIQMSKMGLSKELTASDVKKIKLFYNCPL